MVKKEVKNTIISEGGDGILPEATPTAETTAVELDAAIEAKKAELAELDEATESKNAELAELDAAIEAKKAELDFLVEEVNGAKPDAEEKQVEIKFRRIAFRHNGKEYNSAALEKAIAANDVDALKVVSDLINMKSGIIEVTEKLKGD